MMGYLEKNLDFAAQAEVRIGATAELRVTRRPPAGKSAEPRFYE